MTQTTDTQLPMFQRMVDLLVSSFVLMGQSLLHQSRVAEVSSRQFNGYNLKGTSLFGLQNRALWRAVFVGESTLVGPWREENHGSVQRTGIFNKRLIRLNSGMEPESQDDSVVSSQMERLSLLMRGLISALLVGDGKTPLSFPVAGIPLVNDTSASVMEKMLLALQSGTPQNVFFVNAHCVNVALENAAYSKALQQTGTILPDGIGVSLAARYQKVQMVQNLNGTDLFPKLCRRLADAGHSIYLLGGEPGVTNKLVANLQRDIPNLVIAGHQHGFFDQGSDSVVDEINRSGADVLFVAMGVPLQELWLTRYHDLLQPRLRFAVGGCFDFHSGMKKRAPMWVRECSMEWAFRLWLEPGRMWRRYLIGNLKFVFNILKVSHLNRRQA